MSITLYQVDAFASVPFSGNPAGVCLLETPASETWMQQVASEMALSETAFLVPESNGYNLRWFTPMAEVDLCGHATLASAHMLSENGHVADGQKIRFNTASGALTAVVSGGTIRMNFPAEPASAVELTPALRAAVGDNYEFIGKNRLDYVVELADNAEVEAFEPDSEKILALGLRGLIVTGRGNGEFDFVSRYFAPAFGIPEDPVTGSAHCLLGPYWKDRLGKAAMRARQASHRGGILDIEVTGDRVKISGRAVTTMKIELLV